MWWCAGLRAQLIHVFIRGRDAISEPDSYLYSDCYTYAHSHAITGRAEVFTFLHGKYRLPNHHHRLQGSLGKPV